MATEMQENLSSLPSEKILEIKAVSIWSEIGLVVGGGNIFRGLQGRQGIIVPPDDGHVGAVINGLAQWTGLRRWGLSFGYRVPSLWISWLNPTFNDGQYGILNSKGLLFCLRHRQSLFFHRHHSCPRASEISADIILKATKVDGIYDKDPHKFDDAQKFSELSYMECLEKRLSVMDSTAFSLCMDNRMPILVFDLQQDQSIRKAVCGESIGTVVR